MAEVFRTVGDANTARRPQKSRHWRPVAQLRRRSVPVTGQPAQPRDVLSAIPGLPLFHLHTLCSPTRTATTHVVLDSRARRARPLRPVLRVRSQEDIKARLRPLKARPGDGSDNISEWIDGLPGGRRLCSGPGHCDMQIRNRPADGCRHWRNSVPVAPVVIPAVPCTEHSWRLLYCCTGALPDDPGRRRPAPHCSRQDCTAARPLLRAGGLARSSCREVHRQSLLAVSTATFQAGWMAGSRLPNVATAWLHMRAP